MKKLLVVVVVVLAVFAIWNILGSKVASAPNAPQAATSTDTVKIGLLGPMSGDAAAYGEPMLNVYKMAVEEINNNGGINGKKIDLVVEDAKCSGSGAVSAATKLVNLDKVEVIFGGFCSSESLAAIPVVEAAKVAIISGGSSSPDLTGKSKFFSRTYPSDASQGSIIAKIAIDSGIKKVYVIHEQSDYPLGIFKVFEKTFTSLGGSVSKEEYPSNTSDFKSSIAKARASKSDALFLIPLTPAATEKFAQQVRDSGWKPKFLVGDLVITTPELLSKYKIFEGAIGATFGVDESNTKYMSLLSEYKAKYGKDVPYSGYAQTIYDSVYLVADAVKEVGNDGEKVAEWLHSVKDWQGASGSITINSEGDRIGGHQAKIVKNGKAEIYKE
jgi:branched-chain amino acid transport system substrate-binding protein